MRTYAIYIYEYIQPELAPPSHFHLRIQTLEVLRREVEGMALNVCHQLQDAGVKVKEMFLSETIMFRFHVRLWKCIFVDLEWFWKGKGDVLGHSEFIER